MKGIRTISFCLILLSACTGNPTSHMSSFRSKTQIMVNLADENYSDFSGCSICLRLDDPGMSRAKLNDSSMEYVIRAPHDSILLIDRQAVFDDTGKIIIPGTRLRNDSPIMNKCQDLVCFLNEHKISYLAVDPYGTAYVELPWRSGIIYQFLISPDDCLHLTALRYFKISCDTNEISRFRDSRLYILPEECAVVQSEDFGFATLF